MFVVDFKKQSKINKKTTKNKQEFIIYFLKFSQLNAMNPLAAS